MYAPAPSTCCVGKLSRSETLHDKQFENRYIVSKEQGAGDQLLAMLGRYAPGGGEDDKTTNPEDARRFLIKALYFGMVRSFVRKINEKFAEELPASKKLAGVKAGAAGQQQREEESATAAKGGRASVWADTLVGRKQGERRVTILVPVTEGRTVKKMADDLERFGTKWVETWLDCKRLEWIQAYRSQVYRKLIGLVRRILMYLYKDEIIDMFLIGEDDTAGVGKSPDYSGRSSL